MEERNTFKQATTTTKSGRVIELSTKQHNSTKSSDFQIDKSRIRSRSKRREDSDDDNNNNNNKANCKFNKKQKLNKLNLI